MNTSGISAQGANTLPATKRVRIETPPVQVTPSLSAVAAAKSAFTNGTYALHVSLQDKAIKEAKHYAELLKLLPSKEKSLLKYDDDSFMPQSLCFNFALKGTSRTSKSEIFAKIQEAANNKIATFQKDMRKLTKDCLMLDIEGIKEELALLCVRTTRYIT